MVLTLGTHFRCLVRIYRYALGTLICMSGIVLAHGEPQSGTRSVVGMWIQQPRSPPGHIVSVIEWSKKGNHIAGHWRIAGLSFEALELHNLRFQGDSFSFESAETRFRGRFINPEEISFGPESAAEFPAWHFTFRRASAADVGALKEQVTNVIAHRIPLPVLHDVPSNGLALTPPMGWNSWNYFQTTVDDQSVRGMADAMVSSGLRDAGYVYLVIDNGWQGGRDDHGRLHSNSKFPDMRALADYVHAKGLKFGLYSSPGPLTCGGPFGGYLGSHGYEVEDAHSFAQWDIDFLKYDLCSAQRLYTKQTEIRALFQKMGDALQATGRPIVYSINGYTGHGESGGWGHKAGANLWRTSDDIADAWNVMVSNGFQNHGDRRYVASGAWNDPDMLEVGNGGMNLEEYRTHFTLWAMLAAPLFLGNDLRAMTPPIRDLLTNREVIAVDQDRLGQVGRQVLRKDGVEIWTKPLSGARTAVALFNSETRLAQATVRWAEVGLSGSGRVRDLWAHTNLETPRGSYTTTLLPHGTVLLSVDTGH